MPVFTRHQLTTLQAAQTGAANGTAANVELADIVIAEITGTYTNITVNWEGSIDGGTTYHSIALAPMTTRTYAVTATAVGLYLLQNAGPLTHIRARTTIGAATGSMTVKLRAEQV